MKKEYMIYATVFVNLFGKEKGDYEVLDITYDDKYVNYPSYGGIVDTATEELNKWGETMDIIIKELLEKYGEMRVYKLYVGLSFYDHKDWEGEVDTDVDFEYETFNATFIDTNKSALEFIDEGYVVHVLSTDLDMSSGIAKDIDERYDMQKKLAESEEVEMVRSGLFEGEVIVEDKIFNLIAKKNNDGTYERESLAVALLFSGCVAGEMDVKKLAIAKINNCDWNEVKEEIKTMFANMQIEVLFCED